MSNKPLSEMADFGYDNMSEESGYILHEIKSVVKILSDRVEAMEEKIAGLMDTPRRLESMVTLPDLLPILAALENRVDKEQFQVFLADYNKRVLEAMSAEEIIQILNISSSKLSKLRSTIEVLAEKLDAEDVANLDTDYAATAEAQLSGV